MTRHPILALEKPDHAHALAFDVTEGFTVDQPSTLLFLDATGGAVGFSIAEPKVWPAEHEEGEFGHPLGRFGHQTLALKRRIEPETALVAAHAVVRP
jgi:hypothetical protein